MDSILNMRRLKELSSTVVLKVAQITAEKPDFKIVVDQYGNSHKLMRTDFLPMEWENIRVGSEFAVPIRWSINGIRLIPKKLPIEKEKAFARGANREIIKKSGELLGLKLEEFVKIGLLAMQRISQELGLS